MENAISRSLRIASLVASAFLLSFPLSSCGCTGGVCKITPHPPAETVAQTEAETRVAPTILEFDPASLTVGIVMAELKELVGSLSSLIQQTSGEFQAVILQAQQSTSQLLGEMDYLFAERQADTFEQLNETERRMAEDALALLAEIRRSVELAELGAMEVAKTSLHESDILAYDAFYNLPCRDKLPRFVYPTIGQFRVWRDDEKPTGPEVGTRTHCLETIEISSATTIRELSSQKAHSRR
jgi:hypothetical protein